MTGTRRHRARPVRLVALLMDAAWHIWWKLQLFAVGVLHLLFSSDKQWQRRRLPASSSSSSSHTSVRLHSGSGGAWTDVDEDEDAVVKKQKRILFVRHAESEWNVVFNRGVLWRAAVSFCRAVVREWLMLPTSDSVFIDSPLSRRGLFQAQSLQEQVCETSPLVPSEDSRPVVDVVNHRHYHHHPTSQERSLLRYLCCPMPGSIVVASNLRRSIDTARITSASRLDVPGEKIHVLSCLQEIGRNIDTLTISEAYGISSPALSRAVRGEKHHDELFNVSENHGNKAVLGSGRDRLERFAQWVFQQPQDVIVVYGHSLWFRSFCQEFFPRDVYHENKSAKLRNCAVVSFLLEKQGGKRDAQFRIRPESFQHLI